jgi:hypothetical protein
MVTIESNPLQKKIWKWSQERLDNAFIFKTKNNLTDDKDRKYREI